MKMIIDGKKVDSVSKETFDVIAPATGIVVDNVPKATAEDIEKAVTAAVKGQKEWEKFSVTERADVLYKFIDIVELNKESLAQTLCAENGKPITEARAEIGNIKIAFRAFAEHAKHYYGSIIPPGTEAGQENVYVYSVDGSPASKKALVEHTGGMMGIGAQSPINLGKKAVKIANAVLNGEDYEKETYEETFFINRDNVEMYGTDGWQ